MSTKNVRNIKAIYELASAAEIADGKAWYPVAGDIASVIADQYGLTKSTVIACCAALSPRNRWERNVLDTETLIAAYVASGPVQAALTRVCTFRANKAKAIRVLEHESNAEEAVRWDDLQAILSGPKLREFADCISGRDNCTIDGHAWCIWQGSRVTLADVPAIGVRLRREIKLDYSQAAEDLGLKASELQAITWVTWRRIHGVTKSKSF